MSYSPPCPHCGKPMGERLRNKLAPKPKRPLGPNRTAAVETSQDGWCAICDELPIPSPRSHARFTCGRESCLKEWARLCVLDLRWRVRGPPKTIHSAHERLAR